MAKGINTQVIQTWWWGAVESVNWQTGVVVLDTGDISTVVDKNYVTDAQLTVLGNTSGVNTGDQHFWTFTADFETNTSGIYYKTVTVTDANVTPTSKPVIALYNAGVRDADEIEMVDLKCSVSSVGTGTFDVYVSDWAMQAEWTYTFNYSLI